MLSGASFGTILQMIYANGFVRAAVGLVIADVLTGIALAFYNKDFRLGSTGDFLLTRAIPYFIGAGGLQVVLLTVPIEWSGLSGAVGSAVWTFVVLAMLGHLLDNLRQMGLPIPAALGDRTKPEVQAKP